MAIAAGIQGSACAGAFWENLSSMFPAPVPLATFDAAFLRRREEPRGAAGAAGGKRGSTPIGSLCQEEQGHVLPVSSPSRGHPPGQLVDAWGSKPHVAPCWGCLGISCLSKGKGELFCSSPA